MRQASIVGHHEMCAFIGLLAYLINVLWGYGAIWDLLNGIAAIDACWFLSFDSTGSFGSAGCLSFKTLSLSHFCFFCAQGETNVRREAAAQAKKNARRKLEKISIENNFLLSGVGSWIK